MGVVVLCNEGNIKFILLYHDIRPSWSVGIMKLASTALNTMSFQNPKYSTCASKPMLFEL